MTPVRNHISAISKDITSHAAANVASTAADGCWKRRSCNNDWLLRRAINFMSLASSISVSAASSMRADVGESAASASASSDWLRLGDRRLSLRASNCLLFSNNANLIAYDESVDPKAQGVMAGSAPSPA